MEIREKIKKEWGIEILDEDVKLIQDNIKFIDSFWFVSKLAKHYGLEKITKKQEFIYKEVEKTPFCNTDTCREYITLCQ